MPSQQELGSHVVAFVDILGITDAALQKDQTLTAKLIGLLTQFTGWTRNFDYQENQISGGTTIRLRPAISTFSDNVVVSYDISQLIGGTLTERNSALTMIYLNLNEIIAQIAAAALDIGYLIRGGVAIGQLFHKNNVVFGSGLINAFELESRIAKYPRVIVSQEIVSQHPTMFRRGYDGLFSVDYYSLMITFGRQPLKRIEHARKISEARISEFRAASKLSEMAKWIWFLSEFEDTIQTLAPKLREQVPPRKLL